MRIGYMRYSQSFQLDFNNASAKMLGTELRLGILEGLLQLGHKVYILSKIPRDHLKVLDGEGDGYDYSIFKNLRYYPEEIPKLDVLIIEASTTNIRYGGKAILRIRDVLERYAGTVIFYHHSDRESGFPIGAIVDGEGSNFKGVSHLDPMNYKRLFENVNYDDKRWVLWTHANPQILQEKMESNRFRYSKFNDMFMFRLGYSKNFDYTTRIKPFSKRKYDLVYIGREKTKYRTEQILKLYGDDDCKRLLYGLWENPPKEFDYAGFVPGQGNMYAQGLYEDAVASIVTGDKFFLETGMMTTRVVQSIRAGCITFVDSKFENAWHYIDQSFFIGDHRGTHMLHNLKTTALKEILMEQRRGLMTWKDSLERVIKSTKV